MEMINDEMKFFFTTIMTNDKIKFFLTILVVLVVFFVIKILKKKNIDVVGMNVGPINLEISPKSVEVINVLSVPIAACKGEVLTPALKVVVMDEKKRTLKNRKVALEIYGKNGLLTRKKTGGILLKNTDKDGIVEFDNIVIKDTGNFKIYIVCERKEISVDEIDIFPPGLSIDFWNYKVGSKLYEERMDRFLRFKSTNS